MDYVTRKCLERHNEDVIASYQDDGVTKTMQADSDEQGLYVRRGSDLKIRLSGNDIIVETEDQTRTMSLEGFKAFVKAIEYLEQNKSEDGTVADLGAIPTGHYTHSLDIHDDEESDDGW